MLQTCSRHPEAGPFMRTCSGCARELHDLQFGTPAPNPTVTAKARAVLGLPATTARPELGETSTRTVVWSLRELDAVHARTGGRITARDVQRPLSDGSTYTTVEVTLAVQHDDFVAPLQVVTDWDPGDELEVLSVLNHSALQAFPTQLRGGEAV